MMAFAFLPREGIVPYEGAVDQLVDDASDFILRGIGMREAVIATSRAAPPLQLAAD
jgi:hypothetical protein